MDSNHRRRKPADLQSAPFGHSGICPDSDVFTARLTIAAAKTSPETAAKLGIFFYPQNFLTLFFILSAVFPCISQPAAAKPLHRGLCLPQTYHMFFQREEGHPAHLF